VTGFVLGIDVGGTTVKAGLVGRDGAITAVRSVSSRLGGPRSFRRALEQLVAEVLAQMPPGAAVAAAGMGCKGRIDTAAARVRSLPGEFRYLEGEPLDRWIAGAVGRPVPVRLDNDARTALAGELRWGAARGRRNVALLTLGSGVGGAAFCDGRMLQGHAGAAGHLGHVTVDVEGPHCSCGNRGCVEAIFSARAIEGDALAAVRRGCESSLHADFAARPDALTCADVFRAAARGDVVARAIVRRAAGALSAAMAGIAHALDPELFLLGGSIAAAPALIGPLRSDFWRRTERLLGRRIPVRRAALGGEAGIAGAGALAWDAAGE
jgi:glucokinase